MVYYVDQKKKKRNTAGAKAPDDITELCRRRGYTAAEFTRFPYNKSKLYQRIWVQIIGNRDWYKLFKKVTNNDVIIYQHPSYGKRTTLKWLKRIKTKGCKLICLIHDLESLRGGIAGEINTNKTTEFGDNQLLKIFDAVICHNEHMRRYLISCGFEPERITNLGIFDYLTDCELLKPIKGEEPSIAIAGNLAYGKCSYIYKICDDTHNLRLKIHLFGNNFEEEKASANMVYHGSFKPEELPEHLKGDFGLVWDGNEAYTCAGNTGEYLKYNNPHKTSLYLASGLPVIVWSQAAIADFVLKNGVGITVDSVFEVEEKIKNIGEDEYQKICTNVKNISDRIRNGYFFYKVFDECLTELE